MPRGRPRNTPVQETPQENPSLRDQAPSAEQGNEPLNMNVAQYMEYFQLDTQPEEMVDDFIAKLTREQALAQGMQTLIISPPDRVAMPEGTPEPVQNFIEYFELHRFFQRDELVNQIDIMTSALRMEQSDLGASTVPHEPRQEQPPETLPGYMAENFREDIRSFMQNFGIGGHPPESVYESIADIANRARRNQPAMTESPMEQIIPLCVRINSLEMDGDTRAFAAAEYGDLTINRIRVKQDEYGTLSATMPKFRQPTGWKETCAFNTVEARNRLTGAVLDAYEQMLAQIQGQTQAAAGTPEPEQPDGPEEGQDFDGQEPSGPVMGMSQL